jgi:hypothetical protein
MANVCQFYHYRHRIEYPDLCPSINSYFPQSLRQIRIIILEILPCIPLVKILIFLDLAKTISFLDGHEITTIL